MSAGVAAEIQTAVTTGGLLLAGQPALVLLSGGRDSVCLLDVAVTVSGPGMVTALHVNYQLRHASADDEIHCRELCDRLGVPITVHTAENPSGNVQAWARDVRYRVAEALALDRDAVVAAGHTATDQVETILYRLASSPSRRALLGMRSRDGVVVRPLLAFTREQTAAYCRERALTWRDDETNESDRYARGRVRNGLVPALCEVHPGAQRNVLALASTLREEAEALDAMVDGVLQGADTVTMARLRQQPAAIARLIAQRLADAAAGRPAPGTAKRTGEILALGDTGVAHLDLPHGVRATVTEGILSFGLTPHHSRGR